MRVAVIGAGLAGLSASCRLARADQPVTLFERRPFAGGKTYSFHDRETGEDVDNGQHIFMACMTAYTAFLRALGTLELTARQGRLRVPILDRAGRRSDLWAAPLPSPLHLAPAFAFYQHLKPIEKLRIARAFRAIQRTTRQERLGLNDETFASWLARHGQTASERDGFWDLIVVPALNCPSDEVSAEQGLFIFQEGFLKSATSAAIGLPRVSLHQLHVVPAMRYLEGRGSRVRLGNSVAHLETHGERVEALVLATGERLTFDAYVLALPPAQVLELLPVSWQDCQAFSGLRQFRTSPIVDLHLWFDGPITDLAFMACTGSDIQWVFNRSSIAGQNDALEHLVISLSAASRFMTMNRRELERHFLPRLAAILPRSRERKLIHFLAMKEPEATFVPAPSLRRPGPVTPLLNCYLAGAYTDTGWPATMESAVRSGVDAAKALLSRQGHTAHPGQEQNIRAASAVRPT